MKCSYIKIVLSLVLAGSCFMLKGCRKAAVKTDAVETIAVIGQAEEDAADQEKKDYASKQTRKFAANYYWAKRLSVNPETTGLGFSIVRTVQDEGETAAGKVQEAVRTSPEQLGDLPVGDAIKEKVKNVEKLVQVTAEKTEDTIEKSLDKSKSILGAGLQKTMTIAEKFQKRSFFPGNVMPVVKPDTITLEEVIQDSFLFRNLPKEYVKHAYAEYLDDKAAMAYRLALKRFPKSTRAPDALYKIGVIYMKRKDYTAALDNFIKISKNYPENMHIPEAVFQTGICLQKTAEYSEAINKLYYFIDKYPRNSLVTDAYQNIAECYFRGGAKDKALEVLRTLYALRIKPLVRQKVLLQMADIQRETKDYEKAVQLYNTIITMKKHPFGIYYDQAQYKMGLAYLEEGDYDSARTVFEDVIRSYSLNRYIDDASFSLAESFYLQKNYSLAAHYLDTYLNKFKEYDRRDRMLYLYGNCLYEMDLLRQALGVYETILQKYPLSGVSVNAKFKMAIIYKKLGDYDEAKVGFGRLLYRYPDTEIGEKSSLLYADCLFDMGKWNEAIASYRKYLKVSTDQSRKKNSDVQNSSIISGARDEGRSVNRIKNSRENPGEG